MPIISAQNYCGAMIVISLCMSVKLPTLVLIEPLHLCKYNWEYYSTAVLSLDDMIVFLFNAASSDELTPVDGARFQVLDVDERGDIRSFVQKNGLIFKTGRGFYEFTKPEKISDKKEVVLVDKVCMLIL